MVSEVEIILQLASYRKYSLKNENHLYFFLQDITLQKIYKPTLHLQQQFYSVSLEIFTL